MTTREFLNEDTYLWFFLVWLGYPEFMILLFIRGEI